MPSKTIVAIVAITILTITSIIMGLDFRLIVTAIITIAGLGGYAVIKASAAKKKD